MGLTRGKKISLSRQRIGLTPKDFAKLIGKSPAYVSRLENDDPNLNPSLASLYTIAQILGVPGGYLVSSGFDTVDEYLSYWVARHQLRSFVNADRYKDYFPVIERAIREAITPAELADALAFLVRHKHGGAANLAVCMMESGHLVMNSSDSNESPTAIIGAAMRKQVPPCQETTIDKDNPDAIAVCEDAALASSAL